MERGAGNPRLAIGQTTAPEGEHNAARPRSLLHSIRELRRRAPQSSSIDQAAMGAAEHIQVSAPVHVAPKRFGRPFTIAASGISRRSSDLQPRRGRIPQRGASRNVAPSRAVLRRLKSESKQATRAPAARRQRSAPPAFLPKTSRPCGSGLLEGQKPGEPDRLRKDGWNQTIGDGVYLEHPSEITHPKPQCGRNSGTQISSTFTFLHVDLAAGRRHPGAIRDCRKWRRV